MLKVTSLKSKKAEEKFEEKLKKIHSKSLKEIQNTPEYKLNLIENTIYSCKRLIRGRIETF